MEAVKPHKVPHKPSAAGAGELVLQNGRQAGARRPLIMPTTFLGRNAGCEVRLNVDGVDPLHCLLFFAAEGVQIRDLDSVHGTYVNGQRIETASLNHGDTLKVGPFQFRVELTAQPMVVLDEVPIDEYRDSLRIQAAAVAAQQIALEEEEARIHQRHSDMQQQEEQLAAHLAEKQRQVQLWSEYAKAERETLRKEKVEQEKRLARIEQELDLAKQELGKDNEKLTAERQRINRVYQRLKQRWQKQWSAEKDKYQKQALTLQDEAQHIEERQAAATAREEELNREVARFHAERELSLRQLQESRAALAGEQDGWRRRRSLEQAALKAKERDFEATQLKIKQAHQLLHKEKQAWDRQLDSLQKELHGLNNRVLHQRDILQQRTAELARLDAILRERQQKTGDETAPECEVVVLADDDAVVIDTRHEARPRFDDLEHLASELADQRLHLIEQYRRLAEIQDHWQRQRDYASAELESLARRLVDQEQSLAGRAQHADAVEGLLRQRQEEIETIRQEIQIWRAQLRAREQMFEEDQQRQLADLRQKETLLQEQGTALTKLRERWNRRRRQEVEQLRTQRAAVEEQQQEIHKKRIAMFETGQQTAQEKRILAEKALALEQYRQEVFCRAKDPAAERRVERLRRRWLTLNADLIRDAKNERTAIRKELARLEAERTALTQTGDQLTLSEMAATEKQTLLEEREIVLQGRQAQLEQELASIQSRGEQPLRIQEEVDTLAKEVYTGDSPALDNAA